MNSNPFESTLLRYQERKVLFLLAPSIVLGLRIFKPPTISHQRTMTLHIFGSRIHTGTISRSPKEAVTLMVMKKGSNIGDGWDVIQLYFFWV
jgi:hypothetical protein